MNKNTDKHWSDYLPPALVKDWRQCLRSRGFMVLFVLLQLAGWFFVLRTASDAWLSSSDVDSLRGTLFYIGLLALVIVLPYRAGAAVSADTRVRGTNFLMLTPLSARRIVWGTWCSTAVQILLAALLALPMLLACACMKVSQAEAAVDWACLADDATVLALLVLLGWLMSTVFMFTAGLSRFFRIALLFFTIIVIFSNATSLYIFFAFHEQLGESVLDWFLECKVLPQLLLDSLAIFLLHLELTRRHYAAPAENCSLSVRVLGLFPLLIFCIMLLQNTSMPEGSVVAGLDMQCAFATVFLLYALLADALLPTWTMPVHARRALRGVPVCLQVPGLLPSTICILLGVALIALSNVLYAVSVSDSGEAEIGRTCLIWLNIAYSLLLWLLLTDVFCRRRNRNRPVVYGLVALLCFMFSALLISGFRSPGQIGAMLLPLFGVGPLSIAGPSHSELVSGCGVGVLVLILVVSLLVCRRNERLNE